MIHIHVAEPNSQGADPLQQQSFSYLQGCSFRALGETPWSPGAGNAVKWSWSLQEGQTANVSCSTSRRYFSCPQSHSLLMWKGAALRNFDEYSSELSSLWTPNNNALATTVPFLFLTPLQEAKLAFGQAALNSNTSRCIPVQPQAALQEFWGRSLEEKVISVYWDSWDLPVFGLDRGKLSSQKN